MVDIASFPERKNKYLEDVWYDKLLRKVDYIDHITYLAGLELYIISFLLNI